MSLIFKNKIDEILYKIKSNDLNSAKKLGATTEEELFEQISNELENNQIDKGLWTKAEAESARLLNLLKSKSRTRKRFWFFILA